MSKYTGPRVKKMRALGVNLPGLSRKTIDRRPYPPGDHGAARRGRKSDYGLQLAEKQKVQLNYGITERQLRRLVREARSGSESTGTKLLELLERRIDNVVFRAGYAPTIPAARQLVGHRHLLLNGRRADRASMRVSVGDVIQLREKSKDLAIVTDSLESVYQRPSWLEFDAESRSVKMTALPSPESLLFELEVQLVVEFYSRKL